MMMMMMMMMMMIEWLLDALTITFKLDRSSRGSGGGALGCCSRYLAIFSALSSFSCSSRICFSVWELWISNEICKKKPCDTFYPIQFGNIWLIFTIFHIHRSCIQARVAQNMFSGRAPGWQATDSRSNNVRESQFLSNTLSVCQDNRY